MTYPVGQRLLLRTPIHWKKPDWYEVKTEPNREGIQLLQTDSGVVSGFTVKQITEYLEAANEHH